MNNKNKKIVTSKQFAFFGGVAISLLAVIIILNTGVPARVLGFVPYYLFGLGALPFAVTLYLYGVISIFRGKFPKLKFNHVIGYILVFVGTLILLSVINNKGYTSLQNYNYLFFHLDGSGDNFLNIKNFGLYSGGYSVPVVIEGEESTITYSFGGGLLGHALGGILVNDNNQFGAYLVAIVSIIIGLAMMFFDTIKSISVHFFNKRADRPVKEKPVVNQEREVRTYSPAPEEPKEVKPQRVQQSRIVNIDPVKNAGFITATSNAPRENVSLIQEPTPAPINNQNNDANRAMPIPNHIIEQSYLIAGSGFVRAKFTRKGQTEERVQPVVSEPVVSNETPVEVRHEQISIFEESNVEKTIAPVTSNVNPVEEVVRPAPSPVSVSSNVSAPTPVINKPKVLKWVPPSSGLLEVAETKEAEEINERASQERMQIINDFFKDFNIGATVEGYTIGPSVTRFHVRYNSNVSSRTLVNAMQDISLRLEGVPARFEQVVQGKSYSGIEVENVKKTTVSFKDVYEALPDVKKHPLAIAFGKNVQGDVVCADFNDFPHALLAGTTGSGKSIFINSIITTLIMRNSPNDVKLVLVDPKRIELIKYRDIPHLLCPVISEPQQAKLVMQKLVTEMEDRYLAFENADGATSLQEYNEYAAAHGLEKLPFIVGIVDEFGDLVAATNKEISPPIVLLGQKARACGIHLLIATQRPSVDIITGVIKANLPTHIALCTGSYVESTTILGEGGAEKLLGRGDMLVQSPILSRSSLVRLQGCFIQKQEISRVTGYLKDHYETVYNEKFMNLEETSKAAGNEAVANGSVASNMDAAEESKYQSIKDWVMCQQYVSMSKIQGDCGVGFNRARRFFNRLQQEGVVGMEVEGNKGCRVLMHDPHTEINDDIPTSDEQSTLS